MKTTRVTHSDGRITSTNFMLDDIIDAFEKHGIDNDDLIKELTVQKIEYGRSCIAQLLCKGGQVIQTMKNYHKELDGQMQQKITEVGGEPREININF